MRFRLFALLGILAALPAQACTDADAAVKGPEIHLRAVPGDTIKVTIGWHLSRVVDSTIVTVSSSPNVGSRRLAFPGSQTSAVFDFIPAPALVEGQTVTITACFASKRLTAIQTPCLPISANYTKPIDPGQATPDSLKLASWYIDPPLDSAMNVHTVAGSEFTFCRYWIFADSGVAMRNIDATPTCLSRMAALYPPSRIKLNGGLRQLITDAQCVTYIAPRNGSGGTITLSGPTPCDRICDDAAPPVCSGTQGLFKTPVRDQLALPARNARS